ncbi:Uncharacterized protein Tcan_18686 [Toxocara canis]|uniref:Palmitoyltransferase n=1 Tax=Toxocara canis TaxID=6265 RepID=A0A0B2ULJ4_TOXCA|nr:Uncharacterized protein Tcan_18686 [Toxocara canis]
MCFILDQSSSVAQYDVVIVVLEVPSLRCSQSVIMRFFGCAGMGGCADSVFVRFFICVFRWMPVCLIIALVIWAYYAYVIQLCFRTVERLPERVIYLFIFHFLLLLFLWSYYQTVFSEIGQPQKTFYLTSEVRHDLESAADEAECKLILDRFVRQHQIPVANRAFDGSVRYCHKCNCVKPDRSHHCSVCGQCVLKFDHHCPWVNTCVNYCNYKFFVLFLGYGLALCLFGFFTDVQYFIAFWKNELKFNEGFGRFHILFLFFVSGMFAVSLSCLFFYHLYLTSRNQSTIGNVPSSLRTLFCTSLAQMRSSLANCDDTDHGHQIRMFTNELKFNEGFGRFHILFLFFVSGMFAVSLSCLFFYHLYLTSRNQSTIESFRPPLFSYGPDKNAYNLGIRRNFQQIFGQNRLLWLLPIFSSCGDGVQYPINIREGRQQHPSMSASSMGYQARKSGQIAALINEFRFLLVRLASICYRTSRGVCAYT